MCWRKGGRQGKSLKETGGVLKVGYRPPNGHPEGPRSGGKPRKLRAGASQQGKGNARENCARTKRECNNRKEIGLRVRMTGHRQSSDGESSSVRIRNILLGRPQARFAIQSLCVYYKGREFLLLYGAPCSSTGEKGTRGPGWWGAIVDVYYCS